MVNRSQKRAGEMTGMAGPVVLIGTVLLMIPAIMNGSPLFYFDSAAYMESGAKVLRAVFHDGGAGRTAAGERFGEIDGDRIVQSGRSVYYGVLAFAGWKTTIWLPVLVQCLALAWLVVTHARNLAGNLWPGVSLAILAILAFGTSAAFFAGLVMPDIWAGLGILALALLWSDGCGASRGARAAVFAILAFATLSHASHLALFAVLTAGGALARPFLAEGLRPRRSGLAIPALAVLVGLAGQFTFSTAVRMTFGEPPLPRPFVAAHLVDMGPGTRFLQEHLPRKRLRALRIRGQVAGQVGPPSSFPIPRPGASTPRRIRRRGAPSSGNRCLFCSTRSPPNPSRRREASWPPASSSCGPCRWKTSRSHGGPRAS